MIKAPISLQDLRRRIYAKAKAEESWRFWGLFVHVCKLETLHEAYRLAKENDGAPGIDGVTFEAIETASVEAFLKQIRDELVRGTYRPMQYRHQAIPKGDGQGQRILSIPSIRDRVVQGALKLIHGSGRCHADDRAAKAERNGRALQDDAGHARPLHDRRLRDFGCAAL